MIGRFCRRLWQGGAGWDSCRAGTCSSLAPPGLRSPQPSGHTACPLPSHTGHRRYPKDLGQQVERPAERGRAQFQCKTTEQVRQQAAAAAPGRGGRLQGGGWRSMFFYHAERRGFCTTGSACAPLEAHHKLHQARLHHSLQRHSLTSPACSLCSAHLFLQCTSYFAARISSLFALFVFCSATPSSPTWCTSRCRCGWTTASRRGCRRSTCRTPDPPLGCAGGAGRGWRAAGRQGATSREIVAHQTLPSRALLSSRRLVEPSGAALASCLAPGVRVPGVPKRHAVPARRRPPPVDPEAVRRPAPLPHPALAGRDMRREVLLRHRIALD